MVECTDCNDMKENELYGINYLKYGPNFQLYMIPALDDNENPDGLKMQHCYTEEPKRVKTFCAKSTGNASPATIKYFNMKDLASSTVNHSIILNP